MFFSHALVALVGFGSLVASAPAPANGLISRRSLRARESKNNSNNNNNNKNNNNNNNKNNNNNGQIINIQENTVIIQQTIVQPQVTIIEENLGLVNQLALIAEQEFQALVQSQLALIQEIETIKNNIRVNTFLARFSQVNTVIVSVTQVIDLRNGDGARNTRYMVNQQLANNGKSQSTVVVMLSAASPVTINAAAPTLNLGGLLSNNTNGAAGVVSAAVAPTATAAAAAAVASASASNSTTSTGKASNSANIVGFDSANPFGQLGQTVILPYGSKAPSLPNGAQLVADPASIILAGQSNLIVEDINQFNQDCQLWNSNSLSLFNLQSSIIQEAAQIAALQVSGLSLGSAATLNSAAAALLAGAGSGVNVGVNVGAGAVAATTSAAPVVVETTVAAAPAAAETTTSAAAAPPAVESVAAAAPPAEATTVSAAPAATAAPVAAEPVAAAPVGFFTPTPAAPAAPAATEAAAVAAGAAVVSSAAPEAAAAAASAAADTGSGVQFVPVAGA